MKMDAARCAVVGPSGLGGFERRSTHSVLNLLSIVKRLSIRAELFFSKRPCEVPATVPSAGGACLRRVPEFSSLHMSAHLAHMVAEATSFSSIRRGLRHEEHL